MNVKDAINKRYSARDLIREKEVSVEDLKTVLEAGLKAPSGTGIEPWKFYVTRTKQEEFKNNTHQEHVLNAPVIITVTTPSQEYLDKNPAYIVDKYKDNGFDKERIDMYMNYLGNTMGNYAREQCFFPVLSMALQATELGLSTCIIGGFDNDGVKEILDIKKEDEEVVLVLTLGYSKTNGRNRNHRKFEEVVVFKD